jgi:integrase/recombinase XerD
MLHPSIVPAPGQGPDPRKYLPAIFPEAGQETAWKVLEFFTANIRNPNTRQSLRAGGGPVQRLVRAPQARAPATHAVPAYVEELGTLLSRPSVKQHLAAIRMLFDYLVVAHLLTPWVVNGVERDGVPPNPLSKSRRP